jgi:5-methylcytosine-specific restriction endonuclease McrA
MPRHRFYNKAEWQSARRQALYDAGYRCQRCHVSLIGKGKAAVVHHVKEYKRAPSLGLEPLNLRPLCSACHNAVHADMRKGRQRGCDPLGRPVDVNHPWFRVDGAGSG